MKNGIPFLLLALSAGLQGYSEITWLTHDYDFGLIEESAGLAKGELYFVNIGSEPTLIKDVKPGCGCTSVDFFKGYIEPGDTSKLSFSYNPEGRPGRFKKNIKVYEGENRKLYNINFSGTVLADSLTLSARYPHSFESLRIGNVIYPLGNIRKGKRRTGFINIYNSGHSPLTPYLVNETENLDISLQDNILSPGEESVIIFSFKPDSTIQTGHHVFEFEIGISETATRKIEVTATVVD